jgi:hypothetical protein
MLSVSINSRNWAAGPAGGICAASVVRGERRCGIGIGGMVGGGRCGMMRARRAAAVCIVRNSLFLLTAALVI